MSSINPHYTFEYSQPEAYRFSHDSVFLARKVFELYRKEELASLRGLDLCAGCGIIGLDFIYHCINTWQATPASFDFVEVQQIYNQHFYENVRRLGAVGTQLSFINKNYNEFVAPLTNQTDFFSENTVKYDLVLCNPPYFRMGQGKMSPSEFKNRCRFFMDADFTSLIKAIENSLAPGGCAYILLRDLEEHNWNPFKEAQTILSANMKIEKMDNIRGTDLVCIKAT